MPASCVLQLHASGVWRDVAAVSLHAPAVQGWRTPTYTAYDTFWAVEHQAARDAHALGCRFPVRLDAVALEHWPPFLIDLLPQGFGRGELLRRLGLPETARDVADWPLLLAGRATPSATCG